MGEPIIKVENLSKKYVIGHNKNANGAFNYNTFRESMASFGRGMYQRLRHPLSPNTEKIELEEFWALKDVSFEINQGDRVGIIGRNGAGKSTLLKLLCRITEPTSGRAIINGRVASLLEVGTGFHPELTGRENVYMNGAILGMKRVEIKAKFDEIVDFSGVEKFLDTPVKRYSSGMYVRLAFAVAAHLEPEILLVDEVLAVGDAAFQKKCLGKMEDISKGQGRTILFVSHNMGAISSLCDNALLLSSGSVKKYGATSEVIMSYLSEDGGSLYRDYSRSNSVYGDDFAELLEASVSACGRDGDEITLGDSVAIRMKFKVKHDSDGVPVPNIHVFSSDGSYVFVANSKGCKRLNAGVYESKCIIPEHVLNDISYTVGVALTTYHKNSHVVNFFDKSALMFSVKDSRDDNSNRYGYGAAIPGVVRPQFNWEIKEIGT